MGQSGATAILPRGAGEVPAQPAEGEQSSDMAKGLLRARGLRRDMSLPEVILSQHLRGGNVNGLRFGRAASVGPFVLVFYCADKKLAMRSTVARMTAHLPHRGRTDDVAER